MKKKMHKKVVSHLRGDIKNYKKEVKEDRELIHALKKEKKKTVKNKKDPKKVNEEKFRKVMREFGKDELHSGSKKGPKVRKRKQAMAIAFSEAMPKK